MKGLIRIILKIQRVDALPLLGTGKLDYVTLKTWAENA